VQNWIPLRQNPNESNFSAFGKFLKAKNDLGALEHAKWRIQMSLLTTNTPFESFDLHSNSQRSAVKFSKRLNPFLPTNRYQILAKTRFSDRLKTN
jgi:hypothetical protein